MEAAAGTTFESTKSRPIADFLYETFYGGAIGGSILALFFLAVDALAGQPLFTPSLVATAIFTDAAASASTEVRMDMVAYFSVFHLTAFLVAGAALSLASRSLDAYSGRPIVLVALTFALLTGGFSLLGMTLAPGVVGVVGIVWIAAGNLLTSIGMVAFLERARRAAD